MKLFRIYFLVLALGLAGMAVAEEVRGLYEAEIPVADQLVEARQQAMRSGLAEVLVRVTGSNTAPQEPALADMLVNASRYVQQYRYHPITTTSPAGLALWLAFDANSVNEALRSRGQPVWGSARPLLLVWLVVDNGSERRLVSAAEGSTWPVLEKVARQRGVPLRLPLLDLEDQTRVTAADVWGEFMQPVAEASARYRPQAVLLGRLSASGSGLWHAQWTLQNGGGLLRWDTGGLPLDQVLLAGLDTSADSLARRFAHVVDQGDGSVIDLQVIDVRDLNDYARLLSYLAGLNGVTSVQVSAVEPRAVTCRLVVQVPPSAMMRVIGLGSTLAPTNGGAVTEPQAMLHYRLLP